ncbi:interleukin-10 receptor subunit beta-like [Rhinoderma darwinii]|uniref:interleukin-10 receptor subunit beta-like n=1 Tax=Rhinoderma darwinii TaxID=43563 RepID=UPI003F67692B
MDYYYGLIIFICFWNPGFGNLPGPINVTMESINFRNILRWNRPTDLEGDVTYTVQYKMDVRSSKTDYKTICVTQELQCIASVISYNSYVRVNAKLQLNISDWVTIYFDPYSHTIIEAPEVKVSSRSGYLDVSINGPFVGSNDVSVKEKYGELIYRVAYWKESDPANELVVSTTQNTEILHDLDTWTMYCVKVQAYVSYNDKAGEFSPVICKKTTNDDRTPSWKIALLFLGSMVLAVVFILIVIVLIIKAYKMTRYIFFPSYSFPQHLKEYLNKPFYNTSYLSPQPTEECGESCEQLTFVSEETEEKDT